MDAFQLFGREHDSEAQTGGASSVFHALPHVDYLHSPDEGVALLERLQVAPDARRVLALRRHDERHLAR